MHSPNRGRPSREGGHKAVLCMRHTVAGSQAKGRLLRLAARRSFPVMGALANNSGFFSWWPSLGAKVHSHWMTCRKLTQGRAGGSPAY